MVLSDAFIQAVTAIIPVIILAAVLEIQHHLQQLLDVSRREDHTRADLRSQILASTGRGEELPSGLARQYQSLPPASRRAWMHTGTAAIWVSLGTLLVVLETLDLFILSVDAERSTLVFLIPANVFGITAGLIMVLVFPSYVKLKEEARFEADEAERWREQGWTDDLERQVRERATQLDTE
ncbi:hypothetical protein ACGFY0_05240 [Streptomyces chartreusis]|uniref:hypothetical protein n=1 Tax=Streptomyces chartreusis TaxID=1969 RepID=UPI0037147A89